MSNLDEAVKAAHAALAERWAGVVKGTPVSEAVKGKSMARIAVEAAAPLIEHAALERAARRLEGHGLRAAAAIVRAGDET